MKKKSTNKTPSDQPKPTKDAAPRSPSAIRDELQAANANLERMQDRYFEPGSAADRKEQAEKVRIAELTQELEVAEIAEIPEVAAGIGSTDEVVDQDVAMHLIYVTGNHRERHDQAALHRLARSIKTDGLQHRIGVRYDGENAYELIYGSRRFAAFGLNGAKTIPAKVYPKSLTPDEVENLRTIENVNREDLSPAERALAVARMVTTVAESVARERATAPPSPTLEAVKRAGGELELVAQRLGRSVSWVRDFSYINRLTGNARQLLANGRIDLGHARELAKVGSPEEMDSLADEVARGERGTGGRDVNYLHRRVSETIRSLRGVPWRLDVIVEGDGKKADPRLMKEKCESCRFNSKSDPTLFEHDDEQTRENLVNSKAGTCLNPDCFTARSEACEAQIEQTVAKVVKISKRPGNKEIAVTPASIEAGHFGSFIGHLRTETIARKARKIIEPASAKASSSSNGRRSERAVDPRQSAIVEAKKQFEKARETWAEKIAKTVASKIAKIPGARILLQIMESFLDELGHAEYPAYYSSDATAEKERERSATHSDKAWKNPQAAKLLRRVIDPTFTTMVLTENDLKIDIKMRSLAQLMDPALLLLAKELGIETEPPPDREKILEEAAEKFKTAAAEEKPDTKTAKSKKTKRAKNSQAEQDVEDSEAEVAELEGVDA